MTYISFYFSVLLVLVYVKNSLSIEYVPPNRKIEAIQNDRYTFGIEDDGEIEIARCTVRADTGATHSFLVRPTYSNNRQIYNDDNISPDVKENVITDRGVEGLCQVDVSNVQDTGPKLWNLEATDFDNELVANVNFTVEFFYKGPLLKYEVRVMESASFLNYMILPEDLKIVTCYVKMNGITRIDLDMHTPKTNIFLSQYTKKAEDLAKRVTSLGHGYCGMKFTNTTMDLRHMPWALTAIDDQGISYRGNFPTRIDPKTTTDNLRIVRHVLLGTEFMVNCLNPITSPFCTIFDNNGALVEATECKHEIPAFTMQHVGEWKCYNGFQNSMESVEYVIELRASYPERVIQWVNETENYVNVGCAVENYRGRTVNYCKMVAPDEQIFNVQPFFATERYLTLGTNFTTATCSMMIRKPLQEFEKGLWRCEIKLEYHTATGTYFAVESTTPAHYAKSTNITVRLNEKFRIFCHVPYYSAYCRILAPNNTELLPEKPREVTVGRCSVTIEHSKLIDNGRWTCSFARETGQPDDTIFVHVHVEETLDYYKSVEADIGDDVDLVCKSGGIPLEYCRFISNRHIGYYIDDRVSNPSGITYHGRGLEYGECGIRIPNIQLTDGGSWTCITRLADLEPDVHTNKSPRPELKRTTVVNIATSPLTGPNIAAIGIGTAVGIVIVTVIFGIIIKQKWNRRRHAAVDGASRPTRRRHSDSSSQNSGSNIFNMESAPRSYGRSSPQPRPRNNGDEEINVFSMENLPRSSRDPEPGPSGISKNEEQGERL